jgi:pimeloyl-ACP methyl ester carboxylesterase
MKKSIPRFAIALSLSISAQSAVRAEDSVHELIHSGRNQPATIVREDCDLESLPVKTECFRLNVPENRSVDSSKRITLSVTVFKSTSNTPQLDPIVYLPGALGGSARAAAVGLAALAQSPFLAQRDLILLDPRGTGRGELNLACPEVQTARLNYFLGQRLPFSVALPLLQTAVGQCTERLRVAGVDLNGYNTIEDANDLADLRAALGLQTWNLFGVFYGTRRALEVMRSHPEGVRSVILDSVVPPDNLFVKPTQLIPPVQRSFGYLFSVCQADEACNSRFPNLEQQFNELVNRYNQQPYRTQFSLTDGQTTPIEFNGGDLLLGLLTQLANGEKSISKAPLLISQLNSGNTQLIDREILPGFINRLRSLTNPLNFSDGTYLSASCADGGRNINASDRLFLRNPGVYASILAVQGLAGISCDAVGVKPVPASFNRHVRSQIPTLLVAGSFDPITIPSRTRRVGEQLSRSTYVEITNGGHVPTFSSPCAVAIETVFLTNPEAIPDTGCTKSLQIKFEQ